MPELIVVGDRVLIEPLEGGRFRVRLTLGSVGDIQALMEAAHVVEGHVEPCGEGG